MTNSDKPVYEHTVCKTALSVLLFLAPMTHLKNVYLTAKLNHLQEQINLILMLNNSLQYSTGSERINKRPSEERRYCN